MLVLFAAGALVIYIVYFIAVTQKLVEQLEIEADERVVFADNVFREAVKKKDSLYLRKMESEEEAFQIFTLYEITKEITTSLSEEEAFGLFKNKLREHVHYEECLLLDPLDDEMSPYKKDPSYFIFKLQGKTRQAGVLAIKGVAEDDKETVRILGHQFALAMRRVSLYQEIGKIAITDALTAVYTRRYTIERLKEEIARSTNRKIKMSFLMIDVDHFKGYNDRYGHLTGDQVLRSVGEIIRQNIREIDIPGRYGGEEFCVVLPDTDREGAKFAAERIRDAAEQASIRAYDAAIRVTVSIGIATYPDDGQSFNEIIDKADWALYRSKKQGRNRVTSFGVYENEESP